MIQNTFSTKRICFAFVLKNLEKIPQTEFSFSGVVSVGPATISKYEIFYSLFFTLFDQDGRITILKNPSQWLLLERFVVEKNWCYKSGKISVTAFPLISCRPK